MSKISLIPLPETIDKIISDFKIVGESKSYLLALKDFITDFGGKGNVIVEMTNDNYKYCTSAIATINKNQKEISSLKKEIERLNNIHTVSYILLRLKQRIKKLNFKRRKENV